MSKYINEQLSILITGVGGGGHGEQILKAIKMSSLKCRLIGADMSPFSKGLQEVEIPYLLPPASDPNYIHKLIDLCKNEKIDVLFHGSEPELKVMSDNRDILEGLGIFLPINPKHVIDICMDKNKTVDFLKRNGFNFPRSLKIISKSDLELIDFFPLVLKPSLGGGGSANIMIAQNQSELLTFGQYLLSIYPEFIVQEYVGTPDSEFTVGVLLSMDGDLINSIAVKRTILSGLSNRVKVKNFSNNSSLGEILAISSGVSQGHIGPYPEVTSECERLALSLGCKGAVNVQCRIHNEKVYVFEINPRFSGTTSLRAMVGYNEPEILIRQEILNEHIEKYFSYRSGYIMRGLEERFIEALEFKEV